VQATAYSLRFAALRFGFQPRLTRGVRRHRSSMPTYKRSAVTAKEGINFIRSAVEGGGCLFIKIEQENDLGVDAIIEFIENERPLNKQIAVQIRVVP
jgi:hypothetical protein